MTTVNLGFLLGGIYIGGILCLVWFLCECDGLDMSDVEALWPGLLFWPVGFVLRVGYILYRQCVRVVKLIMRLKRKKETADVTKTEDR